MGQKLIYVPECHSTNSLVNEINDQSELPEGSVVITSNQTAGRGQRGNVWESLPNVNLTFSVLLRPTFLQAKDQFNLNIAVSLAVADVLPSFTDAFCKLKWPNDIYIDDKKIGGILIENQLKGMSIASSVVGIGLNINQQIFNSQQASSLFNFSGVQHDLNEIFQLLMLSLERNYLDLRAGNIEDMKRRYLNTLYKFNEAHRFESEGEDFVGVISNIDESGRLCVQSHGETRVFAFKEVRFLN